MLVGACASFAEMIANRPPWARGHQRSGERPCDMDGGANEQAVQPGPSLRAAARAIGVPPRQPPDQMPEGVERRLARDALPRTLDRVIVEQVDDVRAFDRGSRMLTRVRPAAPADQSTRTSRAPASAAAATTVGPRPPAAPVIERRGDLVRVLVVSCRQLTVAHESLA